MIAEWELIALMERLEADALRQWIELGWITPEASDAGFAFDEVDVARVRLICDLRYDLEVEEESVSIILSLIDQLHDTRRKLRAFAAALEEQPEDVRTKFAERLRAMLDRGRKPNR
jgi:chaperone modulatory protein CbpM